MNASERAAGEEVGTSRGKQSSVWKYFSKDETTSTVTCKICKSVLKYNKSTSAMHTHLKRHPLTVAKERPKSSQQQQQQSISDFAKCPAITEKRRQQITNLLVNFVVKDIRPLAAVHGEGFREMLKFFEPSYEVPSYSTLWSTIKHQYDSLRENIMS